MPITAPAAPQKRSPRTNTITPQAAPLSPKARERKEGLQGWAQIAAIGCLAKGWYADAGTISIHAPAICDETARIADKEEKLAKGLDWLTMTGPYAALFAAALPMGLQFLVNHNKMEAPPGVEGVMPKEAIEARVRADLAKMQAEALKIQKEAEKELAEVQASMNGHGETG